VRRANSSELATSRGQNRDGAELKPSGLEQQRKTGTFSVVRFPRDEEQQSLRPPVDQKHTGSRRHVGFWQPLLPPYLGGVVVLTKDVVRAIEEVGAETLAMPT
jgi:hypothetical protein